MPLLTPLLILAALLGANTEDEASVLSWATPVALPDGFTFAVGCTDATLRLVDVRARAQVAAIGIGEASITSIACSSDGGLIAVADESGLVATIYLATGDRVSTFQVDTEGSEVEYRRQRLFEFQPGGHLLLVRLAPGAATSVWDVHNGERVPLANALGIPVDQPVDHAAWGQDGSLLVCEGPTGVLVLDRSLCETRASSTTVRAHVGAIAPGGDRLVTSGDGVDVTFWKTDRMAAVARVSVKVGNVTDSFGDTVTSLRYSEDGALVVGATSTWSSASCWEARTGKLLWARDFSGNPLLNQARFVLDDRYVLVSGVTRRLLDAKTGRDASPPRSHPVGASSAGGFVLARSNAIASAIEVWDGETLETTFSYVPLANGRWRVDEPSPEWR